MRKTVLRWGGALKDGRYTYLFALLLCATPLIGVRLVPQVRFDNYLNLLSALYGGLVGSLIAAFIVFRFQRKIERAKFLKDLGAEINRVMADKTGWLVEEYDTGEPKVYGVDFRYIYGKVKWPYDPCQMVVRAGPDDVFHNARHVSLEKRAALGLKDFSGLLYRISQDDDRIQVLVASKALHEYSQILWTVLHGYENGLLRPMDLLSLWRPIDLACPKRDFLAHNYRSTAAWISDSEKGNYFPRWVEFFLFASEYIEEGDERALAAERSRLGANRMYQLYRKLWAEVRMFDGMYRKHTKVDM